MISFYELLFYYSYGIPFLLINIRTAYILIAKHTQFSSSYYRVFFLCALNDILLYISNQLQIRLPSFQLFYDLFYSKFTEPSYYFMPIQFTLMFTSYFTNCSAFLLSINRLTAVWMYSSYERIWRKYTIPILLLSFGGTFVLTFPTFFAQIGFKQIQIDNSTNYTKLTIKTSFVPWNLTTVNSITVGSFTLLGLIVNAFTLYFWQKRKSLIPERHQEFQWRLLFLTIVIYSLHFISFLFNTFKAYMFDGLIQSYRAYGAVSDSMALIPSLAIILVSPSLRLLVLPDWIFSSLRSTWEAYGLQSTTNGNATSIVVQPYSPNQQRSSRTNQI
ncbi:Serpentine receptor class gamma [Aphelenchoides besseyi]|nr:Serpentine receptor class gamma [Aphelenchoides besseyi]